ncbi:hypothetical protein M2352_001202 [Azospirillum fermentarium]|uniref:hypothetical protein n=1 Tax=Azospirillum fermentarium TaxID=1233114 RepID=UPI0022277E9E|nr:hypothetical protein [Azospirillum fermentarium]MCW2245611.1 hypothetical protein [Azospirillum fermentarium]
MAIVKGDGVIIKGWFGIGGVVFLQIAMFAAVIVLVGIQGWDDGAITLAYSKTFATTGQIAITPHSEQAEGFSSVSWFLLNAGIALFQPSFERAILASQVLAAGFFCLSTLMLWALGQALKIDRVTVLLMAAVYATIGPSVQEAANGMEMSLLTFTGLVIIYFLYFRLNIAVVLISAAVFLLTRFEAMVYYEFIVFPLIFDRRRKLFLSLALYGVAVVGVQEWVRLAVFADLFPNTIYAKLHPPYLKSGLYALASRVMAGTEMLRILPLVFLATLFLIVYRLDDLRTNRHGGRPVARAIVVLFSPIAGVLLFNTMIGMSWGYSGRMQTLALPLIILVCGLLFDAACGALARKYMFATVVLSGLTVLGSWYVSANSVLLQGFSALAARTSADAELFGVTPASYRLTGLAVDRIRQLTGKAVITFLTPDVGGLGLCCSNIRIIDLGLLTSRTLAKHGYAALHDVMLAEQPDVIEVHQTWALNSNIYNLPIFRENYQSLIVDGTRLYVHRQLAQTLMNEKNASLCTFNEEKCRSDALELHRYAPGSTRRDDVEFMKDGYYIAVTRAQ